MEMEKEKQKQKENEEHHIDKKQKTGNQQNKAVKAPRPRKYKLDPTMDISYYLNFGCKPLDFLINAPACSRSPPYLTLYDDEISKLLLKSDLSKLRASKTSNNWPR